MKLPGQAAPVGRVWSEQQQAIFYVVAITEEKDGQAAVDVYRQVVEPQDGEVMIRNVIKAANGITDEKADRVRSY